MPCWTFNGPTHWVYRVSPDLNFSNRPVRTRLPGGVAGEERKTLPPMPICFIVMRCRLSAEAGGEWGSFENHGVEAVAHEEAELPVQVDGEMVFFGHRERDGRETHVQQVAQAVAQ
jgi:hypothetical protein